MCDDCVAEYQKCPPVWANCDWCKKVAKLSPLRDTLEEGMHGPVYYVCSPCVKEYDERVNEEYEKECNRDDELIW
jgi:hypothetical protein